MMAGIVKKSIVAELSFFCIPAIALEQRSEMGKEHEAVMLCIVVERQQRHEQRYDTLNCFFF
jgi:hypothetical protein